MPFTILGKRSGTTANGKSASRTKPATRFALSPFRLTAPKISAELDEPIWPDLARQHHSRADPDFGTAQSFVDERLPFADRFGSEARARADEVERGRHARQRPR